MARQAIVGCALLLMTSDTKVHRVIDGALSDGHLSDVAVAGRAFHLGPDVRRVIEAHMRFFEESVNSLPRHVFAVFRVIAQRLDTRIGRIADVFMTEHAGINAWDSCACAALHAGMARRAVNAGFIDRMNFMRKVDRLLRFGLDA